MTGINLRVANLKGANMQNCVLHDAVLAGADLEVSDPNKGVTRTVPRSCDCCGGAVALRYSTLRSPKN